MEIKTYGPRGQMKLLSETVCLGLGSRVDLERGDNETLKCILAKDQKSPLNSYS